MEWKDALSIRYGCLPPTRLDLANNIWHDRIRLVKVIRGSPKIHWVTAQPISLGRIAGVAMVIGGVLLVRRF